MSLVEKHAGFIMVARIPRMLRSLLQLALHSCEHKAKELLKHQEWGGESRGKEDMWEISYTGGAPKRMVYSNLQRKMKT